MPRALLRPSQAQQPPQPSVVGKDIEDALWPTVIVVALVVTTLVGLFVFMGSLPAIHERQKSEAIRNGTLRR